MESRFLRKFKCFCTVNTRIQDLKLTNPINKTIKPTQVYIDNENTNDYQAHHKGALSQEPKIRNKVVLEPLKKKPEILVSFSRAVSIERNRENSIILQHRRSLGMQVINSLGESPDTTCPKNVFYREMF